MLGCKDDYIKMFKTIKGSGGYDNNLKVAKSLKNPILTLNDILQFAGDDLGIEYDIDDDFNLELCFDFIINVYEKENEQLIDSIRNLCVDDRIYCRELAYVLHNIGYKKCKSNYPTILQICYDSLDYMIDNVSNHGLHTLHYYIDLKADFSNITNIYGRLERYSLNTYIVPPAKCMRHMLKRLCESGVFPDCKPIGGYENSKLFQEYYEFFNTLRGKCLKSIVINKLDYSNVPDGLLKEYEEYVDLSLCRR